MVTELTLSSRNLGRLAHLNGFSGVAELAGHLGRSRGTLYNALRNPAGYRPTVTDLDRALPFRQVRAMRTQGNPQNN